LEGKGLFIGRASASQGLPKPVEDDRWIARFALAAAGGRICPASQMHGFDDSAVR